MKIIVASKMPGGHRRAGKFIPNSQVEMDVTAKELKAIQADKQIVCIAPQAPAKGEGDKNPGGK